MALALRTRMERFRSIFAPVRQETAGQMTFLKVNPVAEIMARTTGGTARPLYTPTQFQALAKEAFSTNAYGYRAVMQIAQSCAGIKWVLYQNGRSKRSEVENHPLLDLWRRPNPQQGTSAFIEAMVCFWYITGNSYITLGAPETGPNKNIPQQLWTLRPDKVQIQPDPLNFIGGYIYNDYGRQQFFDAARVMQLKFFNPNHDYYGLSPLASAGRMIDTMNAGGDYNYALLHNSAQPPGALVVKHSLEPKQRAKLEQMLREKYSGPSNAGVPMVLEGDEMMWQAFGISPKELQWLEGRVAGIREIGIAVGVPPEMLGDVTGKTYANYSEARESFYEETVLPRMDNIRDQINGWLVPMFGDKLFFDYDRDDIEALAEDRDKLWSRAVDAWQKGLLSRNESRALIKYDPVPDGDMWILPTEMQVMTPGETVPTPALAPGSLPQLPSGTIVDGDDSADTSGGDDADSESDAPDAKMLRLLKRWQRQGATIRIAPRVQHKAVNLTTATEKLAHVQALEASRQKWNQDVAGQVQKQFQREQQALIGALKANQNPANKLSVASQTISGFASDWMQLLAAIYASVGSVFGQETYADFAPLLPKDRQSLPTDTWKQTVLETLAKAAPQKVQGILDTTRKHVTAALTPPDEGSADDEDEDDTAAILHCPAFDPDRSLLVGSLEVLVACFLARHAAAKATGLTLTHEWIAILDSKTRPEHAAANGQQQPLDTPFDVGGEQLLYPGDPAGSMEMIAGCRCSEVYATADEAQEAA